MNNEQEIETKKAVAFDFAGVIASHDDQPYVNEEVYLGMPPNEKVLSAMHMLKDKGFKIIVHSTIADELVNGYCKEHSIPVDEINKNSDYTSGNNGKPVAFVYVDDRALQYKGQSAEDLTEQIVSFKPYWK